MKASPKRSKSVARSCRQAKKKILVIDADVMVAETLKDYLGTKKTFTILAAASGKDGIQQAVDHMPDLILMDDRLSDMSPLDVQEQLKQNPVSRNIPIIYTSEFPSLRVVEQATRRGAKGFVTKPFTLPGIYTKVAALLNTF